MRPETMKLAYWIGDHDVHPVAGMFPKLDSEQLALLAEDIRIHGLRFPIVLYENKVLDGRSRYWGCLKAGVTPRFEVYQGDDPIGYVVSCNLRRRHLDESQRAACAARAKGMFEAAARARQSAAGGDHRSPDASNGPLSANLREAIGKSSEKAAKLLSVSTRSVEYASQVLANGTSELVAAVDAGTVAVSAASKIAELPLERQNEELGRRITAPRSKQDRVSKILRLVAALSLEERGELVAALRITGVIS